MCFFCPDTPPDKVQALGKGGLGTRGQANEHMLGHANDPHQFAIGMKHVCQAEPGCCILSGIGAPCGFTACWARKAVLEKYEQNGLDDFVCFQRYIPKCCCIDFTNQCPGGTCGLILEGCCCPIFSLSIARIHMMDRKNARGSPAHPPLTTSAAAPPAARRRRPPRAPPRGPSRARLPAASAACPTGWLPTSRPAVPPQLRPDPCDYQLIHCSNALQCLSCIVSIVAIVVEELEEIAQIIDLIADLFTCSVAGCMGAQVHHEIKHSLV